MKNGLFLLAFIVSTLTAADVPLIRVDDPIDAPQVNQTGIFLEIRDESAESTKGTPPGALAAVIARSSYRYEWEPSKASGSITGEADLLDARLSPDETVLMILERVGSEGKPNSGRFVFFNLHNGKIVRGITLEKVRANSACFIPGESALIVAAEEQPMNGEFCSNQLLKVSLRSGNVVSSSKPFQQPVRSLAVNSSHCYSVTGGSNFIFINSVENLGESVGQIHTLIPDAQLALSPSGNTLMVYGQKRYELYRLDDGRAELLGSKEFDLGGTPGWGLLTDDAGSAIVLAVPGGRAVLFSGGVMRELAARSSGIGTYRTDDRKLLLGIEKSDALNLYTLPASVEPEQTASPGGLRPYTRSRNFRVFFLTGSEEPEALLIDRRSNISRLELKERRWQKKLIYTAPK